MKVKRKKAFFSISAVAKMFSVHQQTIRFYEKEGLLTPKRSEGNTRRFSEDDIDKLEEIIYLTHELGINLAGVQMILKLKKQIKKMQSDMNKVFEETKQELESQAESSREAARSSAQHLLTMKKQAQSQEELNPEQEHDLQQTSLEPESWDIVYEQEDE